jgi:hypothetical protein
MPIDYGRFEKIQPKFFEEVFISYICSRTLREKLRRINGLYRHNCSVAFTVTILKVVPI